MPWVADLRDSIAANPDRRVDRLAVRVKEKAQALVARLVASRADAVVTVSDAISQEMRELGAERVETIPNGCDFDDFEGLEYHPGERFRITHTGTFFGHRDPRPFLCRARRDRGRRRRPLRRRPPLDRQRVRRGARARRPCRGDPARSAALRARAAARLRGASPAAARGRRPGPDGAVREDLRVPRGRAADPRRGPAGRGRGRARAACGRRRRRRARRRRGAHGGDRGAAGTLEERRARERQPLARSCGNSSRATPGRASSPSCSGASAEQLGTLQRLLRVSDRLTTFFFLATIFSVSFQNVYWDVAGRVNLADVLALLFLVAFVAGRITDRDRLVPADDARGARLRRRSAARLPRPASSTSRRTRRSRSTGRG